MYLFIFKALVLSKIVIELGNLFFVNAASLDAILEKSLIEEGKKTFLNLKYDDTLKIFLCSSSAPQ